MIDLGLSDLKHYQENASKEIKSWYKSARAIAQSADL